MAKSRRVELQSLFEELLGSRNVYFQPPASVRMKYPAIVYSVNNMWNHRADNSSYVHHTAYQAIVIDRDPDSDIPEKICELPLSSFDRFYVADNLNHWVYTLYY